LQKFGQDQRHMRYVVTPVTLKGDVKLQNVAVIQGGLRFVLKITLVNAWKNRYNYERNFLDRY
jgi:hypothetical protein